MKYLDKETKKTIDILCSLKKKTVTKKNSGRWNIDEQIKFVKYYNIYGNKWKIISKFIETRTLNQVRSHAQKYLKKKNKL